MGRYGHLGRGPRSGRGAVRGVIAASERASAAAGAGAEARLLGHGGVRLVAQVAGVSETTVRKGVFELEARGIRCPMGESGSRVVAGSVPRTSIRVCCPALLAMVEPDERGDPESPLRWTTKSLRHLAAELTRQGHRVAAPTVGRLLKETGFSLQGTAKALEAIPAP